MKIIKKVFVVFSLLLVLSASNYLNANSNPTDWEAELTDYLSDLDFEEYKDLPERILVDFMINEKGELIVLSTSFPAMDREIKTTLNYKKISFSDLEFMEKYTLPIVVDK